MSGGGSIYIVAFVEILFILFWIILRSCQLLGFDWQLENSLFLQIILIYACLLTQLSILFNGIFIMVERNMEKNTMEQTSILSCCASNAFYWALKKIMFAIFIFNMKCNRMARVYHLVLNFVTFRFSHWLFFCLRLRKFVFWSLLQMNKPFERRTCRVHKWKYSLWKTKWYFKWYIATIIPEPTEWPIPPFSIVFILFTYKIDVHNLKLAQLPNKQWMCMFSFIWTNNVIKVAITIVMAQTTFTRVKMLIEVKRKRQWKERRM